MRFLSMTEQENIVTKRHDLPVCVVPVLAKFPRAGMKLVR